MTQPDLFENDVDGTRGRTVEADGPELDDGRAGAPRLRTPNRGQIVLQPVDLDALLPPDHPARMLWAAVERLDLKDFEDAVRARKHTVGRNATDPRLLVCLWLYATSQAVASARELDRLCVEHVAYRWICGGVSVNAHLLAAFRVGHRDALDRLLTQVLGKLTFAGLISLERVACDGMRVRASAGAASFRRKERLEEHLALAKAHVEAVARLVDDPAGRAQQRAAQERAAADRLARVQAALTAWPAAQRAKETRTAKKERGKQARVSTTDVEARVMKMPDGGFRPAYNVQLATDVDSRFIVGARLVNVGSDSNQLKPSLDDVVARIGATPGAFLVDGGFVKLKAIDEAQARGVTVYAPVLNPRNQAHDKHARKKWRDTDQTAEWRARMATDDAKEIYKQRAATAETVNADLRCHRGLDRFLVRGTVKALSVTLWAVLTYNLLHAPLGALS